ncbi:MAG TPA: hypothetical protein PK133_07635, partial [Ferruginibacter sp.]|nr:hypothetical protein [Ferruginibacter sp.]
MAVIQFTIFFISTGPQPVHWCPPLYELSKTVYELWFTRKNKNLPRREILIVSRNHGIDRLTVFKNQLFNIR